MSAFCPSAAELLVAVKEFLGSEVAPKLEGAAGFKLKVAMNALDIVARETETGAALERDARSRLMAILGDDGTYETLSAELSERLRSGVLSYRDPAVVAHLWQTTLAAMAIDNPGYASYRLARTEEEAL